jgi:hypothetical protein
MKTVPSGSVETCMKGAFCVGGTLGAGYVGIAVSPAPEGVLIVGMSEFTPESLVDVDRLGMSLVAVSADVDVDVDVEDSPSLAEVWPMVGIASVAVAVAVLSPVVVASAEAAAEVVSSS